MPILRLRRGTALQWTNADPILQKGEPGFEEDTGKFRVGNGTSRWNLLDEFLPKAGITALINTLIGTHSNATNPHPNQNFPTRMLGRNIYAANNPGVVSTAAISTLMQMPLASSQVQAGDTLHLAGAFDVKQNTGAPKAFRLEIYLGEFVVARLDLPALPSNGERYRGSFDFEFNVGATLTDVRAKGEIELGTAASNGALATEQARAVVTREANGITADLSQSTAFNIRVTLGESSINFDARPNFVTLKRWR